jgi:hypothetical protein
MNPDRSLQIPHPALACLAGFPMEQLTSLGIVTCHMLLRRVALGAFGQPSKRRTQHNGNLSLFSLFSLFSRLFFPDLAVRWRNPDTKPCGNFVVTDEKRLEVLSTSTQQDSM